MTEYKSKVYWALKFYSFSFVLFCLISASWFSYETLINAGYSCDQVPMVIFINFLLWLLFMMCIFLFIKLFTRPKVAVSGTKLHLSMGGLFKKSLDVMEFTSIKETSFGSGVLFRYAYHPDSIAIGYGESYSISLAPVEHEKLISHLLSINPKIIVKRKDQNHKN